MNQIVYCFLYIENYWHYFFRNQFYGVLCNYYGLKINTGVITIFFFRSLWGSHLPIRWWLQGFGLRFKGGTSHAMDSTIIISRSSKGSTRNYHNLEEEFDRRRRVLKRECNNNSVRISHSSPWGVLFKYVSAGPLSLCTISKVWSIFFFLFDESSNTWNLFASIS